LAPEVFLLVKFSFAGNEEGITLKESILELDWIILLWIMSALIAPSDGFEMVS